MTRLFCLVAAVMGFYGCAEQPLYVTAISDSHCTGVAKHRAIEASYAGENHETQRAVYKSVYAECTFWQNKLAL